ATTRGLLLDTCRAARGPAVALRHLVAEPRAVAHAGPRRPDRGGAATLADGAAVGPGGRSGAREGSDDQDGEDDGTTRSGDRHARNEPRRRRASQGEVLKRSPGAPTRPARS